MGEKKKKKEEEKNKKADRSERRVDVRRREGQTDARTPVRGFRQTGKKSALNADGDPLAVAIIACCKAAAAAPAER